MIALQDEPPATKPDAFRVFNAEMLAYRKACAFVGGNTTNVNECFNNTAFQVLLEMVCELSHDRAANLMRMEAFWNRVAERFDK